MKIILVIALAGALTGFSLDTFKQRLNWIKTQFTRIRPPPPTP